MNRCVNHPFNYCTTNPSLNNKEQTVTFLGVANQPHTGTIFVATCPRDYKTCEHRITQQQLPIKNHALRQ